MKRLIINIPEEVFDDLNKIASRVGLKKSAIVKIAINDYLRECHGRV